MKSAISIHKINGSEVNELLTLWEESVRASHHFLKEDDIQFFKKSITKKSIFHHFFEEEDLYIAKSPEGKIIGFMGISGTSLEMLFIHPEYFGKGIGSKMIDHAIKTHRVSKVEVNEQNEGAVAFYLKHGFRVISRTETDHSGKPFPHLIMELKN